MEKPIKIKDWGWPSRTPIEHLLHKVAGGTIETVPDPWWRKLWYRLQGRRLPLRYKFIDPVGPLPYWVDKDNPG